MKNEKDYYQILGVKPNATLAEIRRAYRRLAILNHPDKNPTRQAATQMQEINEAYSVLGDEHKRMKYDFEYKNSATTSTSSPHNINTIETANLQQIFSDEGTPNLGYFAAVVLLLPMWVLPLLFFLPEVTFLRPYQSAFPYIVLGILLVLISSVAFWRYWVSFKLKEKESQCPRCGEVWVAEKLEEKMMGIFGRLPFASKENYEGSFVTYGKFKAHCKCKACSYEWLLIKVKTI